MTLVVDASAVVAALVDSGPAGRWAEAQLLVGSLFAPALMPFEVSNVLRRAVLSGDLAADAGTLAHHDLLDLAVDLFAFETVAERAWQLRENVSIYDATYVALAEALEAPLVTLDRRLVGAPGPRCTFRSPPA